MHAADSRAPRARRHWRHGDRRAHRKHNLVTSNTRPVTFKAARDCFARSNDGFRALGIPWGTGTYTDRDGLGRTREWRLWPGGRLAQ